MEPNFKNEECDVHEREWNKNGEKNIRWKVWKNSKFLVGKWRYNTIKYEQIAWTKNKWETSWHKFSNLGVF